MRTALVTGSAGFIGSFVCRRLLADGMRVLGLDALTDSYDTALKARRQADLSADPGFSAVSDRLETPGALADLFASHEPDIVLHLAAEAGVHHSVSNPRAFLAANIAGTFELLEAARAHPPAHLLLASTSSVYGANTAMPYAETAKADTQMSFYAASKKAGEAMAHTYAHLHGLPVTMFRFFTVYGPWGRPDMSYFAFTRAILEGRPIEVYNHGDMYRDFTYIADLVEAIRRLVDVPPVRPADPAAIAAGDSLSPVAPWRVVNIGNAAPVRLMDFIAAIEAATGRRAEKIFRGMQPGDVPGTWADTALLHRLTGYRPQTGLAEGMQRFVDWYRDYYTV